MKKLLLLLFFLTNHLFFAQTSTKTFETESQGSRYFSDNGVVFEIISHSDLFDIQTNFLDEGQKSTISNNRFIAKDSTLSDPSFSIKTTSNLFKVSSFWIQLSSDLNLSDLGELNITGKLNGTVEFSYTKTTGFTTSSSNNNGYVLIDLTDLDGQDYSNITIDELRITANGNYTYVSLDTLTWTKQPQPIALSELDELEVEKNQINIDCYGANTGQAWVTPKGGKSPYTYYWPHSQSTENTARNLAAGRYSVWAIDANGVAIMSEFQIVHTAEQLKIASHWRRDVSCYSSNDGEAGISIYGGTPPYTYSWSPSNHTDFTAINLTEGDHTVTVTDSKGCTLSYTIRVYKQNNGWVPITNTSIVKKYGDAPEVLDAKVPSGLPGGYLNWYIGENKSPTNAAPTIKTDKVGEQIYWVSVATALCPEGNLVKIVVNIEPKELSVRPDSLTKVYGEMDPELTYSVTGLVNNDTLSGHLTRDPGESVGLYYIDRGTLGINVKDNYLFGFTRAPFEITPAVMTGVSLLDSSFAYDATKKELLVSGELPLGAAVTYFGNGQIDAGEYEVEALVQAPNYLDLPLKAKLTIEKIPIKGVSLLDSSFAYDATKKELLVSGELPLGAAVTYFGNGQIDAGEYEVEALVQAPNYLDLPLKAKLTIEKIPMKGVSLLDSSFAYDATKKELLVSGELPLGATVSYSGNGQIDAGEYEVEALVQAPNYLDLPLKAKLTIEKIPMKGVSLLDSSFAYDATKKELLVSGELPLGAAVTYSGNGQIDAGEYEVEALVQAPNYLDLPLKAKLTIEKIPIKGISLLDSSFAYDATKKELLVSGELPLGATVTYFGNGQIDAGEYEVEALVQAPNYLDLPLKAKLTIEKIPMKGVSLLDSSFAYDATKKELLVSGELPLGAAVTYFGNGQIDAGEYEVEALVQAPNYLDLPLKAKLTIEKIPMKGISLLDSSFAYDATKKELLVSGELPLGATVTYFGNGQIDAGEYEVEALVQAPNYLDLPLKTKLTIEKIPMKGVSLLDSSFAYDATKKELLVSGELPLGAAVSYFGNGQIDAGEYEVNALVQAPNYLDLPLKAKLTIEKIPMKGVSLLDSSFAYDATKKELLVSGELPLGAAVSYFGNGQIDAGEYEVEALVQAPNYLDLPLKAKLTIDKAAQSIDFRELLPVVFNNNIKLQLTAASSSRL
ncbi:MBG domain-containing protein, partial [Myroides sp. LJL119]